MRTMIPILTTSSGQLFEADCLDFLQTVESESVDLAFADPPFNLGKQYSSNIDDSREEDEYLEWCRLWIDRLVETLRPGGALFLWNLPKWNLFLGAEVSKKLTFRNWISVDIKYSLPISRRLYPSHYSLLYFVKGKRANIFHPDRLPVPCCPSCGKELRDYGGYKNKMNPMGVSLSDVWSDIPPVRHAKYKKREANALSLKLMDRIISMSSDPGSLVIDPFGGSGTTFVAAELTGRRWLGGELECSSIVDRFGVLDSDAKHLAEIHSKKNRLFLADDIERNQKAGRPLSHQYRIFDDSVKRCSCQQCANDMQPELFDIASNGA